MATERERNAAESRTTSTGERLPALATVRPRAREPSSGDPLVVLQFENGARLRYRGTDDGLLEEWIAPTADAPVRSHPVSAPVEHGAAGETDVPFDDRPSTRVLADRALCSVSSYLSFDDRAQAAFVWGEENVAVLCGDRTGRNA